MKRILKISAFLSIWVVYCFVPGMYSGNAITHGTGIPQNSDSGFFTTGSSSGLLFSNEQTESSINLYNRPTQTNVKNSFNQFSACHFASVKLLNNRYLPYFYCCATSVVQCKSTDIIFPFHYFW